MPLNKGAQRGLFVASGYLSQLARSAKRNFNYEREWKWKGWGDSHPLARSVRIISGSFIARSLAGGAQFVVTFF